MTHSLSITYDDSVLLEVNLTREEFEREAPFLLAAKLEDAADEVAFARGT